MVFASAVGRGPAVGWSDPLPSVERVAIAETPDDPTFRSDLSVNVAAQQRRHQFPHREVAGATEYDHVEGRDRQQPVGVRTRYRHFVIRSLWDRIFQ